VKEKETAMSLRSLSSVLTVTTLISLPITVVGQGDAKPAAKPAPKTAAKAPKGLRTAWGAPDLQGVWSVSTTTPMERPAELADKAFLTPEEAAAWSKKVIENRNTDKRRQGSADVTAAYNDAWYDYGTKFGKNLRTSLIIDPPNGRMPPLTPDGQKRAAATIPVSGFQDNRLLDSWLDRGVWERCITRGVPDVMLPTAYNNNYRIVQTPDTVAILTEMIHDVRIIPLDGRPHLDPNVRQWMGNSIGHWEGDTLVVDVRNFTEKTSFRGSRENLHVTERFTRTAPDLLTYQVTIDDPTTFTKPWTIEMPANLSDGAMYEYACHEGNLSMEHALSGSRAAEKAQKEAAERK
jgi:hypothetical protein